MPSSESQDNTVASTVIDLRKADALYKPFPPFSDWAGCSVDTVRFERHSAELNKLKEESPDALERALEIVKRAAAVDTGAIEGLYETDRGFTFTVAVQAAHWEAALAEKGSMVRSLFESQLKAYDYVLDFATQRIPVAEVWVRELHKVVCESQDTYEVHTAVGKQYQPLPKGEYKHNSNHVLQRDGSIHSWAPVDLTPAEMHRLCEELRSEAFAAAHPVMQAAYAHYAFVSVHPFADGNGRVARALASVFTYRAESIPLLILKGDAEYLPALESADRGDFQRFTDFVLEKAIYTIRLTKLSFEAADTPSREAALERLSLLYPSGEAGPQSSVDEAAQRVDEAAEKLFELFRRETELQGGKSAVQGMVSFSPKGVYLAAANYRSLKPQPEVSPTEAYRASNPNSWWFTFTSSPPVTASVSRWFRTEVPINAAKGASVLIRSLNTNQTFEAGILELAPESNSALRARLSIWIDILIRGALNELAASAEAFFKKQT